MSFGRFAIEKKYVILSLMIAIAIFGLYGRATMNTQLSPDTTPPMVTVVAAYPGAPALDVATDIAAPMEEAFAKLEGITDIRSTSQDFIGIFQLTFDYTTDVNQAAIDIQNTITRIKRDLPDAMEEPQVLKFSTSDQPILTIAVGSDRLEMEALRQLTEENLLTELQLVEGVAAVEVFGGYRPEIQIALDDHAVRAYGLTPERIAGTLASYNITAPGGQITYGGKELLIRLEDGYDDLTVLENLGIPVDGGEVVPLSELAEISLGAEEKESAYRLDQEEALALSVTKKSDANTVTVIDSLHERIDTLERAYPTVQLRVANDDAVFTNQMVDNMTSSVVIAIVLTVIVILSIGFVVDGAIVVVEAIADHRKKGKSIVNAAIDGTAEVALPSIAGVTTTLIVLVPLLFVQGFVGEMFRPLSMTLIFALSSSLVVALLMIPLLSVLLDSLKMPRAERAIERLAGPFNAMMDKWMYGYLALSEKVLANKKKAYLFLMIALVASGAFLRFNGMEMLPKFDSGVTYVTLEMTPGTPIEETTEAFAHLEAFLSEEPSVVSFDTKIGRESGTTQMGDFGMMGPDQGLMTIQLSSRKERSESIWDFQSRLRSEVEGIPGVGRYVVKEKGGTAVTSAAAPLAVKITGTDLDVLYHLADELMVKMEAVPGTTNLYTSYNDNYEQMTLSLDGARMKELGLSSADLSRQLYGGMAGIEATSMSLEGQEDLALNVRLSHTQEADLATLMNMRIASPLGVTVPLSAVAEVQVTERSNLVERENLNYAVKILGFTEDRAFSHVVADVQEAIDGMQLPGGYQVTFTGEQETLTESVGDMVFLLSLAIAFVYLLLVPQFGSFLHPLTIMMAIPLVVIGVAPALAISGKVMSMPVLLGLILLAGTVVNNAILLVDAINQNRDKGLPLHAAIEEAIRSRFRPIMMTAISDVVGMLPLALQLALGSERFSPLAITVIGGITAATFLTIVVIPLIYATFEGIREKWFIRRTLQKEATRS